MIFLFSQSASLGWLFLFQVWILLLWFGRSSQARSPFAGRLDRLLALLVPATGRSGGQRLTGARRSPTQAPSRYRTLAGLRRSAWRWRVPLQSVYEQGYQVTSETISSQGEDGHGRALLAKAVEALKADRLSRGANVPSREDPIVVLAYGLGAWPPGADLTSLEQLLGQLDLSQAELRTRFESLLRPVAGGNQSRAFRELAGASFVLGAASRIVEAAAPPVRTGPSSSRA